MSEYNFRKPRTESGKCNIPTCKCIVEPPFWLCEKHKLERRESVKRRRASGTYRTTKAYQERNKKLKAAGICRRCPEHRPIGPISTVHCDECARYHQEYSKGRRDRVFEKAVARYGGKCACPGCDVTEVTFLQFDHIHNDGAKERRTGNRTTRFYTEMAEGPMRDDIQLLCANCNGSKHRNGGVACAHHSMKFDYYVNASGCM